MKTVPQKLAALLITAAVSVTTMTACAQEVSLMNFIEEGTGSTDLDGYEFRVADLLSDEGFTFIEYKENTTLCDALYQRFDEVEKQFNCTINMDTSLEFDIVVANLMAGSSTYAAVMGHHAHIQELAQGNFATPVTDHLDIVDVKNYDKYGTPSVQECNAYKGEIMALSPLSWIYKQPSALELLIFNMDHVSRNGKTDPREYIEGETWNWEALETVVSTYYVDDVDSPIYSLACRGFDLLKLLCLGNGVSFTYIGDDGSIKTDFKAPNMMEAIDFYNKLNIENSEKMALNPSNDPDWPQLLESFAESQNSMVCLTSANQLYNDISYEVKNYTVMPFPTGPNGEYGVWPSAVEGMMGFVVTTLCEEPEIAFKILDKICDPLPGYETEESRLEYLATNVCYNTFDAKIALTTHRNGTYSYWKAEVGTFQPDTLWRELARSYKTSSSAAVIEKYENTFNLAIEEYMTPNLNVYNYFN